MASLFKRLTGMGAASTKPFTEQGVGGTLSYGGFIGNGDRNRSWHSTAQRHATTQDLLTNVSIVAASIRFFLNLVARPKYGIERAEADKDGFYAEFAESLLHGTDTSWTRLVRRQAVFKFHGHGFHEWVAKRRDDGLIGFDKIAPRPPHTIQRWDLDPQNNVLGVEQVAMNGGQPVYLPRGKLLYFVDDALSDSPEGLGWARQLIESRDRMNRYLKLEKIGFDRNLAGTPVGRAPYAAIRKAVANAEITEEEGKALTKGLEEFVQLKAREPDTSLIVDSQPYVSFGGNGEASVSTAMQYGIELLKGDASAIDDLGKAIERTTWDMALIMGTERLLVGREGAGSLALSEDTSQNLWLTCNSAAGDMAEAYDRDLLGPAWALNGMPPEMRPTFKVEDIAFKDVAKLAQVLADMSQAGAILAPDDPAIDDIRDLAGLSRQPEMTAERMAMLMPVPEKTAPNDTPDDPGDDPMEEK